MRFCAACSRGIDEDESAYRTRDGQRICVTCVSVQGKKKQTNTALRDHFAEGRGLSAARLAQRDQALSA